MRRTSFACRTGWPISNDRCDDDPQLYGVAPAGLMVWLDQLRPHVIDPSDGRPLPLTHAPRVSYGSKLAKVTTGAEARRWTQSSVRPQLTRKASQRSIHSWVSRSLAVAARQESAKSSSRVSKLTV